MHRSLTVAGIALSGDHFIGGRRVPSARGFEVRSPNDWSILLGEIAAGDADTADLAMRAATDAFPAWAGLTAAERGAHLHRLADLIDANIETLALVESIDMAMLLESLRLRVIARGALNFRNYADLATAHEEPRGRASTPARRPSERGTAT